MIWLLFSMVAYAEGNFDATAKRVDAELNDGAKKMRAFFEEKREARKRPAKADRSFTEVINDAGDSVFGLIGEVLSTQQTDEPKSK